MTTNELARLLLEQPDVELLIDDDPIPAPCLEEITDKDDQPAIILWIKE